MKKFDSILPKKHLAKPFEVLYMALYTWQYRVKFSHNIIGKLRFQRYYEKISLHTAQKAPGKAIWKICIVA